MMNSVLERLRQGGLMISIERFVYPQREAVQLSWKKRPGKKIHA